MDVFDSMYKLYVLDDMIFDLLQQKYLTSLIHQVLTHLCLEQLITKTTCKSEITKCFRDRVISFETFIYVELLVLSRWFADHLDNTDTTGYYFIKISHFPH